MGRQFPPRIVDEEIDGSTGQSMQPSASRIGALMNTWVGISPLGQNRSLP